MHSFEGTFEKTISLVENTWKTFRAIYKTIFNASTDAFYLFAPLLSGTTIDDFVVIDANQNACLQSGFDRNNLIDKKLKELPFFLTTNNFQQYVDAFENKTSFEKEYQSDNTGLTYYQIVYAFENKLFVIIRDIAKEKNSIKQTFELQIERERLRLLKEFVREAGHDLRTPLAVINTSAYLIERQYLNDEKRTEYLSAIREQVTDLNAIIDSLSRTAKSELNIYKDMQIVDAHIFVENIVNGLRIVAAEKQQTLSFDSVNSAPIYINIDDMRRVISNLIRNAINYTPQKGSIKVVITKTDSDLLISVIDDGIGIEKQYHEKIFDRYFRVNPEIQSPDGNSGLGLNIAKRIVEEHAGSIMVESMGLNKGSTFIVMLPIIREEAL